MTRDEATRLRAAHVPAARGVVLEVGIGSGLNLPFYTSAVTHLYGVDPSPELLAMATEKAAAASFPVKLFNCGADRIPLARRVSRHGRRDLVTLFDRQTPKTRCARCGAC